MKSATSDEIIRTVLQAAQEGKNITLRLPEGVDANRPMLDAADALDKNLEGRVTWRLEQSELNTVKLEAGKGIWTVCDACPSPRAKDCRPLVET